MKGSDNLKFEKSCGAVVYKYKNNELYILLLKHNSGHWSFPKGHVENLETEEETAIREIKEETNLTVKIDTRFRYVSSYSPKENTMKDVVYFVATPIDDIIIPQKEEIEKIEWVKNNQANNIITYDDDKIMLNKAIDYILKNKN